MPDPLLDGFGEVDELSLALAHPTFLVERGKGRLLAERAEELETACFLFLSSSCLLEADEQDDHAH